MGESEVKEVRNELLDLVTRTRRIRYGGPLLRNLIKDEVEDSIKRIFDILDHKVAT